MREDKRERGRKKTPFWTHGKQGDRCARERGRIKGRGRGKRGERGEGRVRIVGVGG